MVHNSSPFYAAAHLIESGLHLKMKVVATTYKSSLKQVLACSQGRESIRKYPAWHCWDVSSWITVSRMCSAAVFSNRSTSGLVHMDSTSQYFIIVFVRYSVSNHRAQAHRQHIGNDHMIPCRPEALAALGYWVPLQSSTEQGTSLVLRLSSGFPYNVLSLYTRPEVAWY
jgi:hypothetical protein